MTTALSANALQEAIKTLNHTAQTTWALENNKLSKIFVFKDFKTAFAFMTQCALHAEEHNHHPEWFNVYKTVNVQLTTHEANGVSEKDILLAQTMDKLERLYNT